MTEQQQNDPIVQINPCQLLDMDFLGIKVAVTLIGDKTWVSAASILSASGVISTDEDADQVSQSLVNEVVQNLDEIGVMHIFVRGWSNSPAGEKFISREKVTRFLLLFAQNLPKGYRYARFGAARILLQSTIKEFMKIYNAKKLDLSHARKIA